MYTEFLFVDYLCKACVVRHKVGPKFFNIFKLKKQPIRNLLTINEKDILGTFCEIIF